MLPPWACLESPGIDCKPLEAQSRLVPRQSDPLPLLDSLPVLPVDLPELQILAGIWTGIVRTGSLPVKRWYPYVAIRAPTPLPRAETVTSAMFQLSGD